MTTQTTNGAGPELLERLAARIASSARAAAVFGDPVTQGEVTVIPVGRTSFGFGGGSGPDPKHEGRTSEGGGGGAIVKPVGYIRLGPGGARYRPIPDRRLLFGLVALGLLVIARVARNQGCCSAAARHAAGADAHLAQPGSAAARSDESTRPATPKTAGA